MLRKISKIIVGTLIGVLCFTSLGTKNDDYELTSFAGDNASSALSIISSKLENPDGKTRTVSIIGGKMHIVVTNKVSTLIQK